MAVNSEAILQCQPCPAHKTIPNLYLNHCPSYFDSFIHRPDLCCWESRCLLNQCSVDFQPQAPHPGYIETPASHGLQVSYLGAADQDDIDDIHWLAAGVAASCGSLGRFHHPCINRGSVRSSHSNSILQPINRSILGHTMCTCGTLRPAIGWHFRYGNILIRRMEE